MSTGFTEEWLADRLAKQGVKTCAPVVQKKNKYRARKTEVDGILFHSVKESRRYQDLKVLQKAGKVQNLSLQVKFSLDVNGLHIANYFADFCYDEKGDVIVEDVKSPATKTRDYLIKKRLMWAIYRIAIRET